MTENETSLAVVSAEPFSSSDDESVAEDNNDYVDAFPSRIYDLDNLPDLYQLFLWSTVMESIKIGKSDAVPVIPFKIQYYTEGDDNRPYYRVVFMNLESDRALLWDRFDRLYDDASFRQVKTGYEDVDWTLLDKKLLKNPRLSHRYYRSKMNKTDGLNRKGNADNRQSYVLRHMFLVKQHVTPGAKTTKEDEWHIYQLYNVPLMVYHHVSGPKPEDGSFYGNTRHQYKAYLLQPYKAYVIEPGKTYASMSLQKTCYAVLRVTTAAFRALQTQCPYFHNAFAEENIFVPKSQAELDQMVVQRMKRKRGRPTKSLDKIYWYRSQQPQHLPEIQESISKRTKEAEETATEENVPVVPLCEIDTDFVKALASPEPTDIDNYIGNDELMKWLDSFSDNAKSMPLL